MRRASSLDDIVEAIRDEQHVRVVAGGSKPALSAGANLSLAGLSGILEYQPGEFTFTALAGTPVREVQAALAQQGQFLPFDPPLVDAGATLGGTVAAGLSGPGRFRYGGVRDFLLGVRLVTGEARVVYGGGKVVKNAAGFDIPKLMIGSLGRFGVLVEMTFKVFPASEASCTVQADAGGLDTALDLMVALAGSGLDLDSLDLVPPGELWIRMRGMSQALDRRVERLCGQLSAACQVRRHADDEPIWRAASEFTWVPADHAIVKIPLTTAAIVELEDALAAADLPVPRRYSVCGNVAWLAWPSASGPGPLIALLERLDRPGLAIRGDRIAGLLGGTSRNEFAERLLQVFDPQGKFSSPEDHAAPVS